MKNYFISLKTILWSLALKPAAILAADPLGDASEIELGGGDVATEDDVRTAVVEALALVVSFLALIAVVVIIIGGIGLVVGLGSDESRERMKKILIYTVAGLIIVLLAGAIVSLVADLA